MRCTRPLEEHRRILVRPEVGMLQIYDSKVEIDVNIHFSMEMGSLIEPMIRTIRKYSFNN